MSTLLRTLLRSGCVYSRRVYVRVRTEVQYFGTQARGCPRTLSAGPFRDTRHSGTGQPRCGQGDSSAEVPSSD